MNHCYSVALILLLSIAPSLYASQLASGEHSPVGGQRDASRVADTARAEKFVRGQLTFLVSRPGTIRWDVGNRNDYLPLQLNVASLSGSTRVSITVVDQTLAPLNREGLPPNVLPRYYRIVSAGTVRSLSATITLSYSDADLNAAGISDEQQIRVFQWVDGRWVQKTIKGRNPNENTVTVEIDRLSDIILTGAVGPVFKPTMEHIAFGSVRAGQTQMRSFSIENTGVDSLKILSVISTDDAFRIAGVEQREDGWLFSVAFHPTDDGLSEAMLIVEHNAESSPDTLTLSGVGMAPVFSISQSRVDFPKTPVGTITSDTLNVSNYGSDTLIVSASLDQPGYAVSPLHAVIPPLGSVRFALTFQPKQRGDLSARLLFTHNAREKVSEVDVHGVGAAPVFVPPAASLDLGPVYLNESVTRTILVRNGGNAQLEISRITVAGSGFRIEPRSVSIGEGDTASFKVSYAAGNIPGNRTGWIIFHHNALPSADTLRIDVSVQAKPEAPENATPEVFVLRNNYPNPFNPITTIEFGVPVEAHVTLRVFTMLGVQVRTLASGVYQPGFYTLTWDATNDRGLEVATGMYFYRLEAQPTKQGEKPFIQVRKMLFVK